jgi:hypothetical protein
LLLDHRLGHAELVDPVVQGGDVLRDRRRLHPLGGVGLEVAGELEVDAVDAVQPLHVGQLVAEDVARRGLRLRVAKAHHDRVAVAGDAGMADVLVAQQRARVAGQGIGLLGQRRLHVDLHQEVDAAAQVEAEVHRQGMQRGQPLGRAREQVEGDDVGRVLGVGVEGGAERVLGLALGVEVGEARLDRIAVELDEVGFRPALPRMSWTRGTIEASTLTVTLPLDTCTAGASPKKFGSV